MITKFKLFENMNEGEPEVGYYVILNISTYVFMPDEFDNIQKLKNDICKITDIKKSKKIYVINDCWLASIDDIKYWSKNKEDLEPILNGKKYNI
jgi:hypothetical protein